MAQIQFTENARKLASSLIRSVEWPTGTSSVLSLRWSAGAKDLSRGPNGDATWNIERPAGWICGLASWTDTPTGKLEKHAVHIGEIPIILDPKASSAEGRFVISDSNGELSVELLAS
jgi:hypothetical protein